MAQYHSFLVRVWCSADASVEHLAGRLDHLQTGETRRFLDLEQLSAYLRELVGGGEPVTVTSLALEASPAQPVEDAGGAR